MMAEIKEGVSSFTKVIGSASKIVLLLFAGATCLALFTGNIDPAVFKDALLMVLSFYFGKSTISGPTDTQ